MTKRQKRNLIRIVSALVVFISGYIVPDVPYLRISLYIAAYAVVGYDVVWGALKNILHLQMLDEKALMLIATAGAFALKDFPEAAAVMVFYQTGEWFQSVAVARSRKSISSLMDIRPDIAVVVRNGKEQTVSPEEVQIGETIVIRPGEKFPLDGIVLSGNTAVNTSALTGESLPSDKTEGDRVISGCVNLTGVITVRTECEFTQSTVAKILELVENSSSKKARTENFITRFAHYYTPCVVIAAVLLAVIPPLLFSLDWSAWINRALIFLVVSCPCALVISVPLSFFGGIGRASRDGILIKGSNYIEALSKLDTVVFDKTGTLTKGLFKVTAVHPEKMGEDELLDIAAAAESFSNHPIAESIIAAHKGHIDKGRIGAVSEHSGLGIEAVIDGNTVYVGNSKLMDSVDAIWHDCHKTGTIIHIANKGNYLGHIIISDEEKPDSKEAIASLKNIGIKRTVMLTGDKKEVGEAVAKSIGLDEVKTELLPKDKVSVVEAMLGKDKTVAFVGDGINDAPVLMRADVGIAMGALGSDAAIEAADVVLMDDKPTKIVSAIKISKKTMLIAVENIAFALIVKALVLGLGAFGIANMWTAVFADVGVMVIAIINAMRTLTMKTNR